MQKKIIGVVLSIALIAQVTPSDVFAYGGGGGGIPSIIGLINSAQVAAQQAANQGQVLGAAAFRFTRTILGGAKGES